MENLAHNLNEGPSAEELTSEPPPSQKKPARRKRALRPVDPDADRVAVRLETERLAAERARQEYRVLVNEREGGPVAQLPMEYLPAYALGTHTSDMLDALLEEIAVRTTTLRALARPTVEEGNTLDLELHMLTRRAETARELLRRTRMAG